MMPVAAVFVAAVLAGGFGAVLRDAASTWALRHRVPVPWAIAIVNVAGSAVAGAVVGGALAAAWEAWVVFVVAGGFAGGLTTYSTWMLESVQFAQRREWAFAALNLVGSLVAGVAVAAAAAWLAFTLASV